jgi:hypothetical protein
MEEGNIQQESSLLDNFLIRKPEKGKLYHLLTTSSLFYIVFMIVVLAVNVKKFSIKQFDWQLAIGILLLPFLGLFFHLISKKIGWIINCFYYSIITLIAFYGLLRKIREENSITVEFQDLQPIFFTLLGLTLTTLLLSRPIRNYFRVSAMVCAITISVSVGLFLLMIFSV